MDALLADAHVDAVRALGEAVDDAVVGTLAPLARWHHDWHRWGRYADTCRLWAALAPGVTVEAVMERATYVVRYRRLLDLEPDQAAQVATSLLEGWLWRTERNS